MENSEMTLTEEVINKFKAGDVDTEDIVEVFNPSGALSIPEEALLFMPHLTMDHLAALASAYPNQATGNVYLVLQDTSIKSDRQLFPRSTWQNLFDLRNVGGKGAEKYVALTFASRFKGDVKATAPTFESSKLQGDLNEEELSKIQGLKTASIQDGVDLDPATGDQPKDLVDPLVKIEEGDQVNGTDTTKSEIDPTKQQELQQNGEQLNFSQSLDNDSDGLKTSENAENTGSTVAAIAEGTSSEAAGETSEGTTTSESTGTASTGTSKTTTRKKANNS